MPISTGSNRPYSMFARLIDAICAALIDKRHGNLRPRLFEGEKTGRLDGSQLGDVKTEMGTNWLAHVADAKFFDLGHELGRHARSGKIIEIAAARFTGFVLGR